jgi:hypothetical protein
LKPGGRQPLFAHERQTAEYLGLPFSAPAKLIISAVGVIFWQARQIAINVLLSLAEKALGMAMSLRLLRFEVAAFLAGSCCSPDRKIGWI